MRKFVEAFLAALSLIILAAVFLPVALLIKLLDGGPVFHASRRVGLNGKLFTLYKFRTMVPEAEKIGKGITSANDQRITPLGRILRKYKIDELPQLLNVLRGDIAFVGPRPEDPRYVELYSPIQRNVLTSRPGITSPASIIFRHEEQLLSGHDWEERYINEILPKKLAMELEYASRRTLATDIGVILKTIVAVPAQPPSPIEAKRV
jgi:lipopolysaccharide/colanic/teichoic acid biosynthesis glycosyltransferase